MKIRRGNTGKEIALKLIKTRAVVVNGVTMFMKNVPSVHRDGTLSWRLKLYYPVPWKIMSYALNKPGSPVVRINNWSSLVYTRAGKIRWFSIPISKRSEKLLLDNSTEILSEKTFNELHGALLVEPNQRDPTARNRHIYTMLTPGMTNTEGVLVDPLLFAIDSFGRKVHVNNSGYGGINTTYIGKNRWEVAQGYCSERMCEAMMGLMYRLPQNAKILPIESGAGGIESPELTGGAVNLGRGYKVTRGGLDNIYLSNELSDIILGDTFLYAIDIENMRPRMYENAPVWAIRDNRTLYEDIRHMFALEWGLTL